MREVKFYDSWGEFLEECELSHWQSEMDRGVTIQECSIKDFLDQPDISYEVILDGNGEQYIHIFEFGNYDECFVKDVDNPLFWVIYQNGECEGNIYLEKDKAIKMAKELEF